MRNVIVQLDRSTWVVPQHVTAIRMGLDNETLIFVTGQGWAFTVDRSINECIALIGEALLDPPSAASQSVDP